MPNVIKVCGNTLKFAGKKFKCAIGKNGFVLDKCEGDSKTPVGVFPLRKVLFRRDRLGEIETYLLTEVLKPGDGWCDDVNDPAYNRQIELPYPASHENLWREDNLYDIIVVIGYNDSPPVAGKGSAIFMHVAMEIQESGDYGQTKGCISLAKQDLLQVLIDCNSETKIEISE